MSLTRAQLLMGDTSQGAVLRGQVQGVKRGVGVSISSNGAISIDPKTITGVVKTNNVSAFNDYIWPNTNGAANQVLTTSANGTLRWDDVSDSFFKIVFTAKGQLIAGAGGGVYVLENVGVDTSFLVADSTTSSGLTYTDSLTSAVLLPVGSSSQRDCYCGPGQTAMAGQLRYSTTYNTLEFYNGVKWVQVTASDVVTDAFVKQTVPLVGTASAVIVGGSTADRQNAPLAGYFRYNTTLQLMEFYNGTKWLQITSSDALTENYVKQTVPLVGTPSAVIPGGTPALRQDNPQPGYLRYNSTAGVLEFYDSTEWKTFVHDVQGGSTGLTFTGVPNPDSGVVVAGGVLNLASGGTGASTQQAAANNILPPQTGNSGEYLVTNGTNASWQSVSNTLIGGAGIDVTPNLNGTATISFSPGQAIYFPPIDLTPGVSASWGSASGLGAYTETLGPFMVTYPAGATAATIQTRTRCEVSNIAGANYSGTGFIYITNPSASIQVTGQAIPSVGTFQEGLAGITGGFSAGTVHPTGAFLTRTDEVTLTNPNGGTFFLTIQLRQLGSGPNSVSFGFPQFYIQPFVTT